MKDFDTWNVIKKETDKNKKTPMIKEGEICWCKIGVNIGNETLGKGEQFNRPILIIKKFSSDTFWGIPLTSKIKKGSWYHYLKNQDRTLILNQMRLFDRKRLQSRISEIPHNQLQEVIRDIIVLLQS